MKDRWILAALVGVAGLACTGTDHDRYPWTDVPATPPAPPPMPLPPIATLVSGRWGVLQQYSESDAVTLEERGGTLSGTGCSGYLPPEGEGGFPGTCGPLTGDIARRRVRFQFQVDFDGGLTFAADLYASADGQRMAGRYFVAFMKNAPLDGPGWHSEPTAWGRLAPTESWFARAAWPPELDAAWAMGSPESGYDLTLVDDPGNGDDFSPQRSYRLAQLGSGLVGDLGAFLPNELSFAKAPSGETTTISAGPVPETAPGLAVALKLDLLEGALVRVQATMASGKSYAFAAVRR
jgi:hypothetical protein